MPTTLTSRKSHDDERAQGRWIARMDLFLFARDILYRKLPENQLTKAFHQKIADFTVHTPYAENLYLVSRGHFKTSLLTVAKNIQRILADPDDPHCRLRWRGHPCGPNTRILLASNKSENAERMLGAIKALLEDDYLIWLFPDILVADPGRKAAEWTKTAITVKRSRRDLRDPTIHTIGTTGELTGAHYDHGTFDDIVGSENTLTRDEREKTWDFWIKARPLFDPGSTKDIIGTHWHYDDVYARLKEMKQAGTIKLGVYQMPAWRPSDATDPEAANVPGFGWVTPTFPERFCVTKRTPDDTRLSLLEERAPNFANFAAQYLLDPVSADTQHFDLTALKIEADHPPLEDLSLLMTIDPAISTKSHADFSGIAIGGFDQRSDLWILELLRIKRDDVTLVRTVFDLYRRFQGRIRSIGFEAVGFAQTYRILFTLEGQRRGFYLPVVTLPRTTKITKNVRIGGLQGPWNSGQIHILRSCQAYEAFRDEAAKFRPDRESAHDDLLDAVGDLYEYRQTPYAKPAQAFTDDPELADRITFERDLAAKNPALDALSLRVAYAHHRRHQDAAMESEAMALNGGGVALWGM